MNVLENLKAELNNHVSFLEKRPGIVQVLAPLFHEDGDMVDIFITLATSSNESIRISDHGMTLMRLSYSYDLDSPTKHRIFDRIISENGLTEERGRLYLDTSPMSLFPALLQFAQAVAKVGSMQMFKKELIQSLFYEDLNKFISDRLSRYNPTEEYRPLPDRDDLEVDWKLDTGSRPIYLYGVRDNAKARLAALQCREFQIKRVAFWSVIVHEDFENGLSKKDKTRLTSAVDKQFTSLTDFQEQAISFFERDPLPMIQ